MTTANKLTLKELTEVFENTHPALKNFDKSAFSGIEDDYLDPKTYAHFNSFKSGYFAAINKTTPLK